MTNKIFIKKAKLQPLQEIAFHKKAPLKRYLMQNHDTFPDFKHILPGSNFHISAHIISNLPRKIPKYVEPHTHNCDEINLILSENGKLTYKMTLDGKIRYVTSPAVVYIPRGVEHTAEVVRGSGMYICIIMSKTYESSLVRKK